MTDKVQKIREEVERLFNHVKDSNFESDSGAFYYLKDLLDFIDSMQEEPVNLWHDASKIPDNSEDIVIEHSEYGTTIIPACKMSRVKGAKWARLDDILKL